MAALDPPSEDGAYVGRRLQPLRAIQAFRRLVADKEDTTQVFEIMEALTGRSIPWGLRKLLRSPGGGRQAYRHLELNEKLNDPVWLAQFGPGTVGAAYRSFMQAEDLSAEGLAALSRKVRAEIEAPNLYAWYGRRLRDAHDIWHVLTGYGRDVLGEACVVTFSHAQTRSLGFLFIGLGAAQQIRKAARAVPSRRAALQAWRNGRRARWLPAEDYERLLAEPLEAARARLGIGRPTVYEAVPPEVRSRLTLRA
ncbi:MAG TPA: Coq4 family protein [Brevundimonas sp.]|uniref:Coq4 family protein n=1 Tax=Brevundimonas sp. TaxID=1871086 RepID=UPI002C3BD314|nr:Coq4 family protein [Brevundimonas sp.]HRH21194.1 Coq4 family protein [Brevundimonas sp.]